MADHVFVGIYDYEDDAKRILVRAQARGFGGEVEAFLSTSTLRTFASELKAYPLPGHAKLEVRYGAAGGSYTRAAIDCYPFDAAGHIQVEVELRDEVSVVTTKLITSYASLEVFASEMDRALNGDRDNAVLTGE